MGRLGVDSPSDAVVATGSSEARWWHALGIDVHVFVTLLFRGWSVLAGAAMLVLLPLWLQPVELGYYYTFASILALQIFFELGMNQVVTQIASHEIAHLVVADDGALSGDAWRIARLIVLARLLRRWYAIAAVAFLVVVGAAGAMFFLRHHDLAPARWLGPWLAMCAATAMNLYFGPALALIEGSGRVGDVARLRLLQSIAGYGLLALALAAGADLWAAPTVPAVAAVGSAAWLRRRGRIITWLHGAPPAVRDAIDWRREILPFQWRIALSWISGYFIFQLFTPMLFANQGAVQAGRFGMVIAIFNALQSIGMSWVYSKSPQMAQHISRGERVALRALFLSVLRPATAFTVVSGLAVVAVCWWGALHGFAFARRLSSTEVIAFMALNTCVNTLIFSMAVFMRAHKEEPMMPQSVVVAALSLAIVRWASRVSVELTAELYFALTLSVALPWAFLIFRRYWRRG